MLLRRLAHSTTRLGSLHTGVHAAAGLHARLGGMTLSTAAPAAAATQKPKIPGPGMTDLERRLLRPKYTQPEPLRTPADVAKYFAGRAAKRQHAVKPRARPEEEAERARALATRGQVVLNARFRPRAWSTESVRDQLYMPCTIATRIVGDEEPHVMSIVVPHRDINEQINKNVIHNRVFRMLISDVPGHSEPLEYNVICTRLHRLPLSVLPGSATFVMFEPNVPTRVVVPVQFDGVEDCIGRKHGGLLYFRNDRVSAFWTGDHNIPERFIVDVTAADIGSSFHLSDLNWPTGLRPATAYNHLLCIVRGSSKLADEAEAEAAAAAAAAAATTPGLPASSTPQNSGTAAAAKATAAADAKAQDKKK